jgi:hypothetical protein
MPKITIPHVLILLILFSCSQIKYSAWETLGVEKRDLFKREVKSVKDTQEESVESFQDALTKLKKVYAFDGGDLEKDYKRLNNAYENSKEDAAEVSRDIIELNKVAMDLFKEWKDEIGEISSKDLKRKSKKQLRETRIKYEELHEKLISSEKKMKPILNKLKDQVLYLKHNLNSKAVAGLKTEGAKIESDIEKLMKEMTASTKEAEELIKEL